MLFPKCKFFTLIMKKKKNSLSRMIYAGILLKYFFHRRIDKKKNDKECRILFVEIRGI